MIDIYRETNGSEEHNSTTSKKEKTSIDNLLDITLMANGYEPISTNRTMNKRVFSRKQGNDIELFIKGDLSAIRIIPHVPQGASYIKFCSEYQLNIFLEDLNFLTEKPKPLFNSKRAIIGATLGSLGFLANPAVGVATLLIGMLSGYIGEREEQIQDAINNLNKYLNPQELPLDYDYRKIKTGEEALRLALGINK